MRVLSLLFFFCAATALAQQMYKCGNTFSQTPCAADAQVLGKPAPVDKPASEETKTKMYAACEVALRDNPGWKDATSVRVESIVRAKVAQREILGQQTQVRQYLGNVNAKNSYGAYAGARTFACFVDIAESQVLSVIVF